MSRSPRRLICRMHREITLLASSSVISPAQRDTILLFLRSSDTIILSLRSRRPHSKPPLSQSHVETNRNCDRNKDSTVQPPRCFCLSALERGRYRGRGCVSRQGPALRATVDEWVQDLKRRDIVSVNSTRSPSYSGSTRLVGVVHSCGCTLHAARHRAFLSPGCIVCSHT